MSTHREQLKTTGLRVTPTRLAVLSVLASSPKPLDTASIFRLISLHHVDADQATIYRIIENFIEKGLITKYQFQEKKFYYEALRPDHHHAICTKCGNIEDISSCSIGTLEKDIEKTNGFEVKNHSLEFFGLCSTCKL